MRFVGILHRPNRMLETYRRYESRTKRKLAALSCADARTHATRIGKRVLWEASSRFARGVRDAKTSDEAAFLENTPTRGSPEKDKGRAINAGYLAPEDAVVAEEDEELFDSKTAGGAGAFGQQLWRSAKSPGGALSVLSRYFSFPRARARRRLLERAKSRTTHILISYSLSATGGPARRSTSALVLRRSPARFCGFGEENDSNECAFGACFLRPARLARKCACAGLERGARSEEATGIEKALETAIEAKAVEAEKVRK